MAKMTIDTESPQIKFDFGADDEFTIEVNQPTDVMQAYEHLQNYKDAIEMAKMEAMDKFKSAIGIVEDESLQVADVA